MSEELAPMDFQRFWRKLQQMGLNSYEARSYLVLVGHSRFKALELAARAQVPRQKIYEVLDSLAEKGFARVVQEKTKLFSAVEPALAIPGYLARKRQHAEHEMVEQTRLASGLMEDLAAAYSESQEEQGHPRLPPHHRRADANRHSVPPHDRRRKSEYLEFSRPPFAVDPIDSVESVKEASQRGVPCRLLADPSILDDTRLVRLRECAAGGGPGAAGGAGSLETGPLRRASRPDRAAGPRDHEAGMDVAGVRSPRSGRGHEGTV